MKAILGAVLAAAIGSHLVLAQNPSVLITNVPAGLTLSITYSGGVSQLDTPTFGFYIDGIDITIDFLGLVRSGHPLVTLTMTSTNFTVFVATNLTAYHFASHICTTTGLCGSSGEVFEGFNSTAKLDVTFTPTFGQPARWNDPTAPSQLVGRAISGSPTGPNPPALGTRIQIIVDPLPNTMFPAGLFSPFDASAASSGAQCGVGGCNLGININPNGGSHIMHLYESADLANTEDSLEQIEWSPNSSVTNGTTYPNYKIWCGVSNIAAPLSGGAAQGLTAVFDANYTLLPYQAGIPLPPACSNPTVMGPRKVPCGGPGPYAVPLATTNFYPFPVLSPCFDLSTATGASGAGVNLLIEQDIDPGNQAPNFNRYRATAFTPVRRLIDKPLATVTPGICPFNNGGTFDIYKFRFTFVGLVAQGRSLWYDTGVPDPDYLAFVVNPPVNAQPAGTQSTWILEGTDTSNPGPGTTGVSGIYITPDGVIHPNVLNVGPGSIGHFRFFRFRTEFRANNVTNTTPAYNHVAMVYSF